MDPLQFNVQHSRAHGRDEQRAQHEGECHVESAVAHANVVHFRHRLDRGLLHAFEDLAGRRAQIVQHDHFETAADPDRIRQ